MTNLLFYFYLKISFTDYLATNIRFFILAIIFDKSIVFQTQFFNFIITFFLKNTETPYFYRGCLLKKNNYCKLKIILWDVFTV